jgi:hypothetical protein
MRTHRLTTPRLAALRAVQAGLITYAPPTDPTYDVGRFVGPNGSNHHNPLNQLVREGYVLVEGTEVRLAERGRFSLRTV